MDNYASLLSDITETLKPLGFKKKGATYYRRAENNLMVINFQKSKSSTAHSAIFTINLGVCSTLLWDWSKEYNSNQPLLPHASDCHWRIRIGDLLPQQLDHWWQLEDGVPAANLAKEISSILVDRAIPEMDKYIKDENLQQCWLEGHSGGLTVYEMYKYLTVMLKLRNNGRLAEVVEEFRKAFKGKAAEYSAREHLKDLGL
jgi:hypothetical protein